MATRTIYHEDAEATVELTSPCKNGIVTFRGDAFFNSLPENITAIRARNVDGKPVMLAIVDVEFPRVLAADEEGWVQASTIIERMSVMTQARRKQGKRWEKLHRGKIKIGTRHVPQQSVIKAMQMHVPMENRRTSINLHYGSPLFACNVPSVLVDIKGYDRFVNGGGSLKIPLIERQNDPFEQEYFHSAQPSQMKLHLIRAIFQHHVQSQ